MAHKGGGLAAQAQYMETPQWADLEFGSLLGEGAFARVKHARNLRTNQVFALKVVEKRQVQAQQRTEAIINERNIHASLEHDGIIKLYCAWHDEIAFYFALELVEGGDLASQISRMGTCSLGFTQFYVAEMVVILEYLRSRRIVHRDLKPENLLLTLRGHLKLIDFDAAVRVPDEGDGDAAGGGGNGQHLPCAGTSLYLAPEVLSDTVRLREAFALDLWALGCICFLMVVGETPFHTSPEYMVYQRIMAGDYSFPSGFPHRKAQSLIDALLSRSPMARPGMGPEGFDALKQHPFFGGSMAEFVDLLQCRPPQRVDRVSREIDWEQESAQSFEFAVSSAECTPEVGQQFLSKRSETIPVSDGSRSRSHEFHLSVQTEMHEPPYKTSSFRNRRSTSSQSPRDGSRRPSQRFDDISVPSTPSNACRWIRPDKPFMSYSQWLHELVARQTLKEDEDVVICGSVIRRTWPCLRPKVLMVTDKPRLLMLDSSGVRLLQEIPLAGECKAQILAKSQYDFELHSGRRRYCCYDVNGVEDWQMKVESARERVSRQGE